MTELIVGIGIGAGLVSLGVFLGRKFQKESEPGELSEADKSMQLQWENMQRYEGRA